MRGRTIFCFLILFLVTKPGLAFDSTLFNTTIYPHEGFGNIELIYYFPEANNIMQTFLIPCDIGKYIYCPIKACDNSSCPSQEGTLLDERQIGAEGNIKLYFFEEPGLYKICSRLVKDPYYYDCGSDNYYLMRGKDVEVKIQKEYVYQNITTFIEKKDPYVNIYSAPTIVTSGQDFTATVFFHNPGNENISAKAYTFSFYNGECITENCWEDYVNLSLAPHSWKELEFNNSFLEYGNYTFKARMKVGNKTYTDMIRVKVLPRKKFRKQFIYNDSHVGYFIENQGDLPENFTVIVIGSNLSANMTVNPGGRREYFVPRNDGWLYLLNNNELLDSRQIWKYEEHDTGPTSFFVANPNDLNIPLVLISLIALGLIVWKI